MLRNLNIKAPRLGRNRLGVFFVRYPSYVDQLGKRRVIQKSLGTKDPAQAKLLALRFCAAVAEGNLLSTNDDALSRLRTWTVDVGAGKFSAEGEDDHRHLMAFLAEHKDMVSILLRAQPAPSAMASPGAVTAADPAPKDTTSLERAIRLHLDIEGKAMKSKNTMREKEVLFDDFMSVFGRDVDINIVTAEQVTLRWTPVETNRANKKFGGTLSLSRLEKRRGYLSKFFVWASDGGLYRGSNPMKAKLAKKKQIREQVTSYAEFTGDDLAKIFSATYVREMDKPDWYWIPLIGLFSGARLGELCELRLDNFMEIEGIKVFEVQDGKTSGSRRTVPIHPILISLGLWEFVSALRERGATRLLHHRPEAYLQKSVGRQFGVWIERCGIKDYRKVFHSFRSTAITDMHNSEAGAAAIRRTVGHVSPGVRGAHGDYIRGILLVKLQKTIAQLNFPTIVFDGLRLADPTFKAFLDKHDAYEGSPEFLARQRSRLRHEAARKERLGRS